MTIRGGAGELARGRAGIMPDSGNVGPTERLIGFRGPMAGNTW